MNNTRIQKIRNKLTQKLTPSILEIIDDSHKHIGHAGAKSGAGHFIVTISSPSFQGKSLVECHRLVYQALEELMESEIHALQIKIIKEN